MALSVISLRRKIWSLLDKSGQWSEPALNGLVAIDPTATFGAIDTPHY